MNNFLLNNEMEKVAFDDDVEKLLREVETSIKGVFPDCTVIIFGSYARGKQQKNSDLDICVLVPEITYRRADMSVDAACSIRRGFPLPFDLLLYTYDEFEELSQSISRIQHTIKHEGVVLSV